MQNLREVCLRAFRAAVDSVQPYQRVRDTLRMMSETITINNRSYRIRGNVHLAAFGKAALGMVRGAEEALNGHIVEGLASVPRGTAHKILFNQLPLIDSTETNLRTKFREGATDNLPDEDSCTNAKLIEHMARKLQSPNDIFLALISGGGSALLSSPIDSITLNEKRATIRAMASRGADIKQLNIVRQALSTLKGGKLARIASPAKTISLIVSDIVGDPLEYIASGPTILQTQGNMKPMKILQDLNAWDVIPYNVQKALSLDCAQDDQPIDVQNVIVCNNKLALTGASTVLSELGYQCHLVSSTIIEDADRYGQQLANIIASVGNGQSVNSSLLSGNITTANNASPDGDKIALLFGGECTVTTKGDGKGGRNQHIVLVALEELLRKWVDKPEIKFSLLSCGTDGQDGPTDAAGAVLTSEDLRFALDQGEHLNESVRKHLSTSDSYNFWQKFRNGEAHIVCGPTGTNVMDIQVLLIDRCC